MLKRFCLLLLCLLLPLSAFGETQLFSFPEDDIPASLQEDAFSVSDPVTIRLTFGGDCTLGGESAWASSSRSYGSMVRANGDDWPFRLVQQLFAADDVTLVNLEGVLSSSTEGKVKKTFNFIGDPALAQVLPQGSVEAVTLANNHSMDYGEQGYAATQAALDASGTAWLDENTLLVVQKDGQRIGFTASVFSSGAGVEKRLTRQIALLKSLGCGAVVHLMHAGTEYKTRYSARQKGIAQAAIRAGADLVVGCHPHIVQGVEVYDGVPVIYSLGNFSFGGNTNPKDYDALLVSAAFTLSGGQKQRLEWTLWPVSVSSQKGRNNYQPMMLTGEDAQRVIEKVQKRSDMDVQPYQEGLGAVQEAIVFSVP